MPSPVTLTLLAERIALAQQGIDRIQEGLKSVTDQALDRRLSKLEDTVRWLTRTVAATLISTVGAVIMAFLTAK